MGDKCKRNDNVKVKVVCIIAYIYRLSFPGEQHNAMIYLTDVS